MSNGGRVRSYWNAEMVKIVLGAQVPQDWDGGRFLGGPIKACSCQTLLDEISTLMLANPTSNILTNEVMRNVIYVHCTMYVVHDVTFVNEAEVQGHTRHFKQVQ